MDYNTQPEANEIKKQEIIFSAYAGFISSPEWCEIIPAKNTTQTLKKVVS